MADKKCSCGHTAKDHYISDVDISRGKVFCGKDNCTGWNRCDIDISHIKNDSNKTNKEEKGEL